MHYLKPAHIHQTEKVVANSRFIAIVAPASTTDMARAFIHDIRTRMPDANHHVYAFRVGYGNSIHEGVSDDGEPSGTAGPPILAVLRGTDIGDIVAVVVRYFGGTKLGTGGLVRAYGDAIRENLLSLPTELKIERKTLGIDIPYPLYQQVRRLVGENAGVIEDENFATVVTMLIKMPLENMDDFFRLLNNLSAGQIQPVLFD